MCQWPERRRTNRQNKEENRFRRGWNLQIQNRWSYRARTGDVQCDRPERWVIKSTARSSTSYSITVLSTTLKMRQREFYKSVKSVSSIFTTSLWIQTKQVCVSFTACSVVDVPCFIHLGYERWLCLAPTTRSTA